MQRCWIVLALSFGLFGQSKSAGLLQTADSNKTVRLPEIVVTTSKSPKKFSELTSSVIVIPKEILLKSAAKDLAQVLQEQVGIVVNGSNSNPGKDKAVYIRGAKNDYTLILINGQPVNDPSGVGGAVDLRLLPLHLVERIEILKGCHSVLYGSEAVAGVINIITSTAGQAPLSGDVTLSYGSMNTLRASASVNGSMGILSYNAGYSHISTDGISEALDEKSIGTFDNDAFRQESFVGKLSVMPHTELSLNGFFRYTTSKGDFDAGAFKDAANTSTLTFVNFGVQADYRLERGAFHLLYQQNHTLRDYTYYFSWSPGVTLYNYDAIQHLTELWGNFEVNKNLEIIAGLQYQTLGMIDSSSKPQNPSITMASAYTTLFLKSWYGLHCELGARYNHHSRFGDNVNGSFAPMFAFSDNLRVFVRYATGFKSPTLNQLYGQFGANEALKPETSQSLESGIYAEVTDLFSSRFTLNLFRRSIQNLIYYDFNTGYINQDEQKDYGAEAEYVLKPVQGLTVQLHYGFVDGALTSKHEGRDTSYFNLIRRPKHQIGLVLQYQVMPDLFVGTHIQNFRARTDLNFASFPATNVELPAYTLCNVFTEYSGWKFLTLFANINNLFDRRFSEVYGYSAPGITLQVGVRLIPK